MSRVVVQFIAAWVVIAALTRVSLGQIDEKATIEKIVSAWKARGDKVKTMVLELEFKKTIKAGETVPNAPERVLENDLTYPGTRFVWLDGEKMRDLLVHVTWNAEQETYIPLDQTYLFDGEAQWSLFEYPTRKVGFVYATKENMYRTVPDLGPFLQQYRGFTPSASVFNHRDWKLVGSEVVDGHECTVVEEGRKKYWLDPARDWLMVRHEWVLSAERGRIHSQIEYREDDQWGWLLRGWQVDFWRPQRLENTTKWTVKSIKLNAEIDPAKFQMDFPPDTKVNDER
jgi:hypothetical protein